MGILPAAGPVVQCPHDGEGSVHQLVDGLSDEEAETLFDYLNMLADPDELTEEELVRVRQAKAEMERGEYVTLAQLRRELGLQAPGLAAPSPADPLQDRNNMIRRELHEANRLSWNEATKAHNSHKADQAAFFRAGGNKLFPEEMELLGDVAGKDLVHLQCNAGQDSLSLVQMGARVTGVDISDEAIAFARQLSADSGLPATFVRSDVYDWFGEAVVAGQSFDLAFSSYGAICWLSDLGTWARGVASVLRPGGRFVLVEFHPFAFTLDDDGKGVVTYPYSSCGEPLSWDDGVSDYVAASGPSLAPSGYLEGIKDFKNPNPCHEFAWSMADVVTALLDAGLRIDAFREYLYATGWKPFPGMRDLPGRRTAMAEDRPQVPLMFAVAARKEGS